jgi:hypothetical protein
VVLAQLPPPPPAAASGETVAAPASARGRRGPWVVVAACVLAGLFLALWLQTKGQSHVATAEVETLASEASLEPAPAEAPPDLRDLVTELDLWSEGVIDSIEETSVSLHYYTPSIDSLEPLLRELEFSPETLDRIGNTKAIDGTLTATAPHATARWLYEPDHGLSIVIQTTD